MEPTWGQLRKQNCHLCSRYSCPQIYKLCPRISYVFAFVSHPLTSCFPSFCLTVLMMLLTSTNLILLQGYLFSPIIIQIIITFISGSMINTRQAPNAGRFPIWQVNLARWVNVFFLANQSRNKTLHFGVDGRQAVSACCLCWSSRELHKL